MGVEAGLCYYMGSVTAKPEWDIRLLSNRGCNYLRIALTLYPESHTSHKCFHIPWATQGRAVCHVPESHPPVRGHMSYMPTHLRYGNSHASMKMNRVVCHARLGRSLKAEHHVPEWCCFILRLSGGTRIQNENTTAIIMTISEFLQDRFCFEC